MAAATITERAYDYNHLPGVEDVQLTVSDGETYTSVKFAKVLTAQATGNEDIDAHLNVTISGQVVTINYAGQTDKLVSLRLTGIK